MPSSLTPLSPLLPSSLPPPPSLPPLTPFPLSSGREHWGVASSFLNRAVVGSEVRVFVKDTKSAFRLPEDPNTPIILGTSLSFYPPFASLFLTPVSTLLPPFP